MAQKAPVAVETRDKNAIAGGYSGGASAGAGLGLTADYEALTIGLVQWLEEGQRLTAAI